MMVRITLLREVRLWSIHLCPAYLIIIFSKFFKINFIRKFETLSQKQTHNKTCVIKIIQMKFSLADIEMIRLKIFAKKLLQNRLILLEKNRNNSTDTLNSMARWYKYNTLNFRLLHAIFYLSNRTTIENIPSVKMNREIKHENINTFKIQTLLAMQR